MTLLTALLIIALLAAAGLGALAFAAMQKKKTVQALYDQLSKETAEKESLLKKEAMIQAKEALHIEREKFDDEVRERRQDLQRAEDKLIKKEDMLEDKLQEAADKEYAVQKKCIGKMHRFKNAQRGIYGCRSCGYGLLQRK